MVQLEDVMVFHYGPAFRVGAEAVVGGAGVKVFLSLLLLVNLASYKRRGSGGGLILGRVLVSGRDGFRSSCKLRDT